ncbi:MAG: acyl carrier protein [Bacilli bacterium]|nr:acyl carrier protein [Bacilli bacterium]MDD3098986.1 acyl carrier protein [Bacilli bacterium]
MDKLKKIIIDNGNIEMEKFKIDDINFEEIFNSFGYDSINIISLIVQIEDEYNIQIDDEYLEKKYLNSLESLEKIINNKGKFNG